MMDQAMIDLMAAADRLALQARAAAMAGNHKRAAELRRLYDSIYDQLEAQALGEIPAKVANNLDYHLQKRAVTNG